MVINNFQNPYINHGIYASQPLKGESINSSANNMPTMKSQNLKIDGED